MTVEIFRLSLHVPLQFLVSFPFPVPYFDYNNINSDYFIQSYSCSRNYLVQIIHVFKVKFFLHRYRHGARDIDRRYTENNTGSRKLSGGYYDGPSEYGRSYGRSPLDYDRSSDYDRNRDRDPESDSRDSRDSRLSESRDRDVRHPRDIWERDRERDSRHYDDRRDVDLKKDAFERHVSIQFFSFLFYLCRRFYFHHYIS